MLHRENDREFIDSSSVLSGANFPQDSTQREGRPAKGTLGENMDGLVVHWDRIYCTSLGCTAAVIHGPTLIYISRDQER